MKTRENFNAAVLKRDGHQCVICRAKDGLTVHHILDRSLFPTFEEACSIDNGCTVCEACHWAAECGELSCFQVRNGANIKTIVVPEGYDIKKSFDKWGNELVVDRQPMGEMVVKINEKSFDSFERVCRRNSQLIRFIS